MVRPPRGPPTSPPTHWRSSAHSISKVLAPSTLPAMARAGLHLEHSRGLTAWPSGERCRPRNNCPRGAGHHPCLRCQAHSPEHRGEDPAHRSPGHAQMGHTSTTHPRAQLAPTPAEQVHEGECEHNKLSGTGPKDAGVTFCSLQPAL